MANQRRVPTQARSKAKYDHICICAKTLIGEHGNDSVSMREIAKYAEVPISSIYQYFPDKNSILGAIMASYFEVMRGMLNGLVDQWETIEHVEKGLGDALDAFYISLKEDPALAVLWAGMQANPELQALDNEDSQRNAELICGKLCLSVAKTTPGRSVSCDLAVTSHGWLYCSLGIDSTTNPSRENSRGVQRASSPSTQRLEQ